MLAASRLLGPSHSIQLSALGSQASLLSLKRSLEIVEPWARDDGPSTPCALSEMSLSVFVSVLPLPFAAHSVSFLSHLLPPNE